MLVKKMVYERDESLKGIQSEVENLEGDPDQRKPSVYTDRAQRVGW